MKRGFTLLELIVVIIILGILATLGFTQYMRMVEKGRTAEAKMVLGQIRTVQVAYRAETGNYTTTIGNLPLDGVPTSCATTHYFNYTLNANGSATANRCTSGGKTPNVTTTYNISVGYDNGTWFGTPGYI